MDNFAKYNEILDDNVSELVIYECLLCGHEQPTNDLCESCGSYTLEEINFDNLND